MMSDEYFIFYHTTIGRNLMLLICIELWTVLAHLDYTTLIEKVACSDLPSELTNKVCWGKVTTVSVKECSDTESLGPAKNYS